MLGQRISLKDLHSVLDYNADTGVFQWKNRRLGRIPLSLVAGTILRCGHRVICIDQVKYRAHHLAWYFVHEEWPPYEVDHINNIPDDNRMSNLRLISDRWQQRANQKIRKDSRSGYKGVRWRCGNWEARCRKNGRVSVRRGFKTPESAHVAYMEMARNIFGEFARAK